MLQHASEFLVRVSNLAEAEGRDLRKAVGRLGIGFSFSLVAGLLLLGGSSLLLVGVWIGIASGIGPAWSSAITGVIAVALGVGALMMAERYHA